jgi:hypothetical protein
MLRKKIEDHIAQHGYGSVGWFQLFEKVKTKYYCHERDAEVVAHGIVVGIEYLPSMTDKLGCWYKVLIYSIHISSKEHDKMFRKLKINVDDLEEIEIIDVFNMDLLPDKANISQQALVSKMIEYRVNEYKKVKGIKKILEKADSFKTSS